MLGLITQLYLDYPYKHTSNQQFLKPILLYLKENNGLPNVFHEVFLQNHKKESFYQSHSIIIFGINSNYKKRAKFFSCYLTIRTAA